MKPSYLLARTCWLGFAILAINSGCTHNYYYGGTPGCAPIGQTVTTQVGQICEVPSGSVVTSSAGPVVVGQTEVSPPAFSAPNAQRIVISQPAYNPSLGNRLRWRRPDPENLATTRVEGALEDSTVK